MRILLNNKEYKLASCTTFYSRLMGNMFKKKVKCLVFPKVNSIHTFFMLNDIDVIMLDRDFKVIYIYKGLKPWRIVLPKKRSYYVIELPINSVGSLEIGDEVKVVDNR